MTYTPIEIPVDSTTKAELRRGYNADGTKATRVKKRLTSRTATVVSLVIAIIWVIPTFGLLISSFRPEELIKTTGWWTVFENWGWTLDNYSEVLFSSSSSAPQLGSYFVNSIAITVPVVVFATVLAAMAAYALAWIPFKGASILFIAIFALQIVPLQMALIPLLQMFTTWLLPIQRAIHDVIPIIPDQSYIQVWIAHTIFGLPLAIFLLHNFISDIPNELVEAARVDGANHGQIFLRIILPLSVPILASFAIFQFLWVWNDLLVALVFSGGTADVAPLTQRLAELTGNRGQEWQRLTAAAFISLIIPLIVFFSLQRYFVRGLLAGSTKG
ncbi:carbohydrate ABC transporter permease [Agromyces sp. ISL-38]|uniref:carbohydrate ABC transporter permease n=1 Tax=Agromyces sp. ISL-38 TaxID=2819107 RepID=UPI001BEC690E|nr:carbohydrate ABC transporter permease [Agromyces sp. ISL-38]MBT2499440.1 carbohydrate ABC transporter permease [Agromyces sp. ISL-38]MBT2518029.1 carbohydrate ABC transporter permease [Streptomyces sp. ISL-90]